MNLFGIVLLAQLSAPAHPVLPVLEFPEAGIDDTASYRGYQTRFFRDAARNTVQVYLDRRDGRVVNLWADAEDESIGFTVRDAAGAPVALRWAGAGASTGKQGRSRIIEYDLAADSPQLAIGWFLLGSMRVERDFQYGNKHLAPFASKPYTLPEFDRMLGTLDRLPVPERNRELALLNARSTATLGSRLQPSITVSSGSAAWVARVTQPSLDGRDTMRLELRTDPRRVAAARAGDSLTFRARTGNTIPFTVRIATTGRALTPLARGEIFNPDFLRFLAAAGKNSDAVDSVRARRLERQVRGVELLSSREKLMAGLPTYATYFGRDMLMTALMMRPIWREEMSEFAIASALRKLGPHGDVSHEEALGGQAVREGASEYAAQVDRAFAAGSSGDRAASDSLLARARSVLRTLRTTRENYHMMDDEFQLAVLAGRWLGDSSVTAAHKRAFLLDRKDFGEPRLARLVRELALVARMTARYAADPITANLVSFPARDSTWAASSWRDSGVGYAGGRYAMDINAIWAPHALSELGRILDELDALGFDVDSLARSMPDLAPGTPLGAYAGDRARLASAIDTWRGASRHFVVRLSPAEVQSKVAARLAAMPADEREYWTALVARTGADRDSLAFLALSLDAKGYPIGVANSDPATRLFLGDVPPARGGGSAPPASDRAEVLRDVRLFVRPYPVGLLISEVGPVVANDAYASPPVWDAFVRDPYHGPRVVWGREINLFLLGAANRLRASGSDAAYASELRNAIDSVRRAVQASGFHSELWSYEVKGGRVVPARYGTSADVQLWSTTDLAVEYTLSRLPR
jgi:hypothetical protein